MKTRNGVYYDFEHSEYRTTVDGVTFVFSSMLHLQKFNRRLRENRSIINYSLSKRFGFAVNVNTLADIVLYRKIESRGFLLIDSEGTKICQNELIKYVGGNLTATNCKER